MMPSWQKHTPLTIFHYGTVMSHHLKLGILSDEISSNFAEAARYGVEWGISLYELRVLTSGRVPFVAPEEWDEVERIVRTHRLTITALSPGIFKHPLSKKDELERELTSVLPKTLARAKQLDARLVIVFGFQREPDEPASNDQLVVEWFQRAADCAAGEEMTLAVENEPGFWCDSGSNTARIIESVQRRNFKANWDPCNGFGTSERPFPEGYEAIKKHIANVHVKDTKHGALIECVPVGEGAIDWKGQLAALARDRIVQHVTIETHCLPLIEQSRRNVQTLRSYLTEIASLEKVAP
jgi:sugar phosphate isomerase/epimerase